MIIISFFLFFIRVNNDKYYQNYILFSSIKYFQVIHKVINRAMFKIILFFYLINLIIKVHFYYVGTICAFF